VRVAADIVLLLLALACLAAAAVGWTVSARRGARVAALARRLGVAESADLERTVGEVSARAEEADARARSLADDLGALGELVPSGVLRIDDRRLITYVSPAAQRLLGQRDGSLTGRTVMEAFGDHRVDDMVESAAVGQAAVGEVTLRQPGRPTIALHAARSPIGGTWVILEDRTELSRLRHIREEFLDNLSHELRTPLTNIRLLVETLERDVAGAAVPPEVRQRIERIDVETGHLVLMVTEILDLARLEDGSSKLILGDVDLCAGTSRAIDRVAVFAGHRAVTLASLVGSDLPRVRADEERLIQLLVNLLHNAVKFSSPGGEVTVTAASSGGEVVIAVADRGIGIAPRDRELIFERFYKADPARSRSAGGTGLGLPIARHIAEAHGGRIWVDSEEGEGSVFSVALPIAGPAAPEGVGGG
jgi:two-component system phosphate regulon sensor histidine kinase PhoR